MVGRTPPCDRRCTMRTRALGRGQSGQTSVEWLGVMAVLCVVVGLVVAASPPVAQQIVCTVRTAIGKIIGESWNCAADKQAGLPPCVITQGDGQLSASVTVFSIKGGYKGLVVANWPMKAEA